MTDIILKKINFLFDTIENNTQSYFGFKFKDDYYDLYLVNGSFSEHGQGYVFWKTKTRESKKWEYLGTQELISFLLSENNSIPIGFIEELDKKVSARLYLSHHRLENGIEILSKEVAMPLIKDQENFFGALSKAISKHLPKPKKNKFKILD